MNTVAQLVRDQVCDEGPQIGNAADREEHIESEIRHMSNVELLHRISDAIEQRIAQDQRVVRGILG